MTHHTLSKHEAFCDCVACLRTQGCDLFRFLFEGGQDLNPGFFHRLFPDRFFELGEAGVDIVTRLLLENGRDVSASTLRGGRVFCS